MPDVVDLIMNDHREVERLFEELKTHPEKRAGLVPVLTTLLTAHSRAEEAEVYPVAASEGGNPDDVAHSQEEHIVADQLLAKLAATDPEAPSFGEVLQELVDAITHHVEEEETTVLPNMRESLSSERLDELGQAFLSSRKEHLGEQPVDIRKSELQQQARNADISLDSGASKAQIAKTLRREAEKAQQET